MIELRAGDTVVSVVPDAGGRIAQIAVARDEERFELLHAASETPPDERDPLAWGSYLCAPWPNRIAGGRFVFEGREYRVPANHEGNALHGLGYTRPWRAQQHDTRSCELSLELAGLWPFGGTIRQRIEALDDGVRQIVEITSDGARFPAGLAWHPWFRRNVVAGDDLHVLVDADAAYELRAMIPTGRLSPPSGDEDLRGYPAVGNRRIDACYRDLLQPIRLRWSGIELTMTSSQNATHAVVYTAIHAACVEPQTCAIDAFNLAGRGFEGAGVAIVEPGHPLLVETAWRLQSRRDDG